MNLTGRTEFIQGRKLYEREDGFLQDDRGRLFDYRYGRLYEQREPGKWWLIRQPTPARPQSVGDRILEEAMRGF